MNQFSDDYPTGGTAGIKLHENNRVKVLESALTLCPDALPNIGSPLMLGGLAGVSESDAAASTNVIAFDRASIVNVSVIGSNGGNVAVARGDNVYMQSDGTISKVFAYPARFYGVALAPVVSGATTVIPVLIGISEPIVFGATSSRTTATEAVTIEQLNTLYLGLDCSFAGAVALAIPAAASVRPGTRLHIYKSGSAGAITITPAAGTINQGATHATIDADNDEATFEADPLLNNWMLLGSKIA